jgi:hypothetical protein
MRQLTLSSFPYFCYRIPFADTRTFFNGWQLGCYPLKIYGTQQKLYPRRN